MKKSVLSKLAAASMSVLMVFGSAAAAQGMSAPSNPIQFPLEKQIEVSFWEVMASSVQNLVVSLAETPLFQELQERSNLKINFVHPISSGTSGTREQFNLLVASGDIPDIIGGNAGYYTGGKIQAYADGVIIDVLPYVEEYMPNLHKLMQDNPILEMDLLTSEGEMLGVPGFRDTSVYTMGLFYRDDWAEELGLGEPKTVNDLYEMLAAFKEKEGVTAPFCTTVSMLRDYAPIILGAYGVANNGPATGYYVDDGVVKYSPVEEGFKEFLKEMAKWYAEGLIDPEIVALDSDESLVDSKLTSGLAGVGIGYAGGTVGRYLTLMTGQDYSLAGIQPLNLGEGTVNEYMPVDRDVNSGATLCISATNPYIEETLAFLDFGYSKEGHYLYNFGIEGESFEMIDGYPTFTDLITKNPDGLSMGAILGTYAKSSTSGPMIQDTRYTEQYMKASGTLEVAQQWSKGIEAARKGQHTYFGTMTAEESASIVDQQTAIRTYREEQFAKMLTGALDVDANWDTYVNEIYKMGLDDILELRQGIYDKFIEDWPVVLEQNTGSLQDYIREVFVD